MQKYRLAAIAILIAMLAAFPCLEPEVYYLSFMFSVFMYVILASSWNFIGGYAGYLSFGHAAFFGIGAFATAKAASMFELTPS